MSEHPIIDEELALLSGVRTLLEEVPYELPPSEEGIVAELVRIRDEINDAKEEDKGALLEQYNRQLALLEQLREARRRPQVDPDSPYFAHLRLREDGRERDLCLGKATRIARGIRIVDWRDAPISKIFYRYQQGEEYEEEIGTRELIGEVVARRTVAIRGGELERILAPEGSFSMADGAWRKEKQEAPRMAGGQGSAMRVHDAGQGTGRRLGTDLEGHRRRSDKRLPDIAGLIDAEQFDLITQPTSGFVVIRGTAGSGKTTVALHRIAYLAYEDASIDSARTMFVVFSRALRDYVAHVLPALGVERAQVRDFGSWAEEQRRNHFQVLPKKRREDTPALVLRLKNHPVILAALEAQVQEVDAPNTRAQAIDDWMSVLVNAPLLSRCVERIAPGSFSDGDIDRITTWCRDRNEEIVAWLDGEREDVNAELDDEDDALLLRAWQLRVGPLRHKGRPLSYRHIAIDEVQDFSPIEVRVLIETLDARQSITLAGDTQQHVMQESGFTSWEDFFRHLGVEGTAVNTLRVAYRSSHPIVSFAVDLLGEYWEDDHPPMTTRSGPPVELFQFTDHGAAVAFLADALKDLLRAEPLASIAVLTPGRGLSRLYYQGLDKGEVPRLRIVEEQDFTFAPGVEVTEIDAVKGLEFDYVILVETSASSYPDTAGARRMLHVGATRAVHQLWLTSVGSLSPVVREAMQPS